MKIWKILLITFGLTPWPFIISLSAFFFHAGNILNHSPSYGNPDPKELAIYSDYSLFINTSALTWIYSFFVWLILVVLYLIMNRKNIRWKMIGFGAVGHFFAICLLFSGVFEWYID